MLKTPLKTFLIKASVLFGMTIQTNCQSQPTTLRCLENCDKEIKLSTDSDHLKMNSSKTEFILFSQPEQFKKCFSYSYEVIGEDVFQVLTLSI